jgi:aminoglycoside phosphotransferase family enzyme
MGVNKAAKLPDDPRTRVDLDTKVAILRQTATYPDNPTSVDAIETHMSWVFLTTRFAYKLKKPVRYDFLDFSTLVARAKDCAEEVRLNRRLARDVYIGVVPLASVGGGKLAVEQPGEVVEWLVKMRRLPANRMLDYLIPRRSVNERDIRPAARMLATFYAQSLPANISKNQYATQFEQDVDRNLQALSEPGYGLNLDLVRAVHGEQLKLLRDVPSLLANRVLAGRIIEGHGDLRPEHICLEPEPVIIDCLEFNRQFRTVDPVDELAFLAMECERLGAPFVGQEFFRVYQQVTGDSPPDPVVTFYKTYRACLRARLAIWHTHELDRSQWTKWQDLTDAYLRLAAGYGQALS